MPRILTRKTIVYDDPLGPKHEGHFAAATPAADRQLKVVTYNINFGLAVPQAIAAFETIDSLQDFDILLLQEMDEYGSEKMAQVLGCDYVYYPATVARHGRNFGNAVLSRWPLVESKKLVLPGRHPINGVLRIATRATVRVGELTLAAYSVHTETYTVPVAHRRGQVDAIVADIGSGENPVIVGGDFNTVSRRSIARIREQFARYGLVRVSAGLGPTVSRLGTTPSAADHVFARGVGQRIAAGKAVHARASDHFPVWVQLAY